MHGVMPPQRKLLSLLTCDHRQAGFWFTLSNGQVVLFPGSRPEFLSLAVRTANNWKLDKGGMRLVITDSAYGLSYVHLPQAPCGLRHSKEWPYIDNGWNSNTTLQHLPFCQWNLHNDGQPFLETAQLGLIRTISGACLVSPDRLLQPCKVAKHHAEACTPADLYQRVGSSSEPPEPPQRMGLWQPFKAISSSSDLHAWCGPPLAICAGTEHKISFLHSMSEHRRGNDMCDVCAMDLWWETPGLLPPFFVILQTIKKWRRQRPGNEAIHGIAHWLCTVPCLCIHYFSVSCSFAM